MYWAKESDNGVQDGFDQVKTRGWFLFEVVEGDEI